MPARDLYHDVVKAALIADGWTITHDPLQLKIGRKDLFVDLGAEQLVAAEKEGRKIAVEVKSFLGESEVADLEKALGQFILYHDILGQSEPDRRLYPAIDAEIFEDLFTEPIGLLLLKMERLKLLVFDPERGVIIQWIPHCLTDYAKYPYAYGEIERQLVFDRERDHYLLLSVGWDKHRVHGCVIHIDIIDGKCWVQRDGTETGIARDLVTAGIPKDRIVLAFKSAKIRPHTGYAVA